MLNALPDNTFAWNDGFNDGSYFFGGAGTLADARSYLDQFWSLAGEPYEFEMTNAVVGSDVPEPQSAALFGAAMVALLLSRRRRSTRDRLRAFRS